MRTLSVFSLIFFFSTLCHATSEMPRFNTAGYSSTNPEAYRIVISNARPVSVTGNQRYALQTLERLRAANTVLPDGIIEDGPAFAWRGLMLDVSRHFFSVADVIDLMQRMAALRLNRLHLHLTDGPGWRIAIHRYPKLTEIGAWRVDKTAQEWNWRATELKTPGETRPLYGGFYTHDDIRKLVKEATRLGILIVPEIEMPGHSYAALVSYPELAYPDMNVAVDGLRGKDFICVTNSSVVTFYKNVLDEVIPLFPGAPIHIGGDEVFGLPHDARPFLRKITDHVKSYGREVIVWNDSPADFPDVMRTFWTGVTNDTRAILCPCDFCYFDYYQGNPATEPKAIGGYVPLEKVQSFRPPSTVYGIQANLWTEFISTPEHLRYMLFPRLNALADIAWHGASDDAASKRRLRK